MTLFIVQFLAYQSGVFSEIWIYCSLHIVAKVGRLIFVINCRKHSVIINEKLLFVQEMNLFTTFSIGNQSPLTALPPLPGLATRQGGCPNPNLVLSFENNSQPYLPISPKSTRARDFPRLHRLSLMTTTAVILRKCVHKRLAETDYQGTTLISTPLKVILSSQVAQKFDEHQFYISNGINRPTNTEVTILSDFNSTQIYRCLRTHERKSSCSQCELQIAGPASRTSNSCFCNCPGVSQIRK